MIFEDSNSRFWSKDAESTTKTIDYFARQGKRCWPYAVDDRVVWAIDVEHRIGTSAQLAAAPGADEHQ